MTENHFADAGLHVSDLLPAYLNGALSHAEAVEVEAHVADCDACRRELAGWRAIASAAQFSMDRIERSPDIGTAQKRRSRGHGKRFVGKDVIVKSTIAVQDESRSSEGKPPQTKGSLLKH